MPPRHDPRSGSHGQRSGTTIPKIAKITKTHWFFFVVFVNVVIFVPARVPAREPRAAAPQQEPTPTQAQQRPVFRGGTHFVRVDAYPARNGKIVEGLTADDFEILEDGKPQRIESFDFITFEGLSPDAERRDPISQRAGYDLAADPRYRVFVVFVDMAFSQSAGPFVSVEDLPRVQQPLINFFERVVGPQDLYGFLTSRNSVKDLVLAQKTAVTVSQVKDLWRVKVLERDAADELLAVCGGVNPARARADATYTTLTDLVTQLGALRQERKNLVLVTNVLPRWRAESIAAGSGAQLPRAGIERGRITSDDREIATNARGANANGCTGEIMRLAQMDFDARFRALLADAKRENVSFYTITPGGLQAPPDQISTRAMQNAYDDLRSLADETEGLAVTNTNDLDAGFRRIADDLAAYYLLGYYTTNTTFDGGLRSIRVRLKANAAAGIAGGNIRARRQYRAPTPAEISALAAGPAAPPQPTSPPTLVRKPVAFVIRGKTPPEPADLLRLSRTDRLRAEWETTGPIDARSARVLDRAGKPLAVDVPLVERDGRVVVELPLAPFARGDYALELTVGSGSIVERSPLAFRVQ